MRSELRLLSALALALVAPGCLLDWDALQTPAADFDGGTDAEPPPDTWAPPVDAGLDTSSPPKDSGPDAPSCDAKVIVNEVQADGVNGASDEFVELYNTGNCEVSLVGWTLEYSSASASNPVVVWTGVAGDAIKAGGYFVLAGQQYPGTAGGRFGNGLNGVLSKLGGGVGIFAPGANAPSDGVAWANLVNFPHPFCQPQNGPAAPNPVSKSSIARSPNAKDTGSSANDFVVAMTPTPGAKN